MLFIYVLILFWPVSGNVDAEKKEMKMERKKHTATKINDIFLALWITWATWCSRTQWINYEFCDDFFFGVRCCTHTNYQICPLSVNDMRIKCIISNFQLSINIHFSWKKIIKYDIWIVDRIRNSCAHRITIHIDSWELFCYHHSFINCSMIIYQIQIL